MSKKRVEGRKGNWKKEGRKMEGIYQVEEMRPDKNQAQVFLFPSLLFHRYL